MTDKKKQGGPAYAPLPPRYYIFGHYDVWDKAQMLKYADDTHELRMQSGDVLPTLKAPKEAPEAFLKGVIALCSHRGYSPANIEAWDKDDKWIADLWRQAEAMLAASPTTPALSAAPAMDIATVGEAQAFEAWFRSEYHSRLDRNMPDKSYNDPIAHTMWAAWKARAMLAPTPTPPAEQQAQPVGQCVICGSDEPFTGTCGSGDPRALCKQAAPTAAPGDQRKAFESWARRQSWIKDCGKAPDGDAYGHWDTQKAWLAWTAALAAPPAEQQAMESVLVDGAASQPPISNTLWRMLTGGYEHTYILQLPNDSRDRRELIGRACHNWRRICAEIGNSAVASAVSPQTAQAPQQAAPKAAPGESDYSKKWDAELGRTAMRFVDRAGDVHPGIDDAETICAEFHKAMSEVIERMPHVQRMAAPQQEAQEPVWDGKLSDAMRNALDALYLQCGHEIARDISYQVRKECEAIYTSYTTAKRMYQAARDRLGAIETAQPQPDPFAAPQPAPAPLSDDVVKDAARWRWLSEHIGVAWNEGKFTSLVRIVSDKNRTALNASIDRMMAGDWSYAALAAQGGE